MKNSTPHTLVFMTSSLLALALTACEPSTEIQVAANATARSSVLPFEDCNDNGVLDNGESTMALSTAGYTAVCSIVIPKMAASRIQGAETFTVASNGNISVEANLSCKIPTAKGGPTTTWT